MLGRGVINFLAGATMADFSREDSRFSPGCMALAA